MNITQSEIEKLCSTTSEQDWNKVCDEIKAVRDDQYPPDWWEKVMMSGLAHQVAKSWSQESRKDPFGITITVL